MLSVCFMNEKEMKINYKNYFIGNVFFWILVICVNIRMSIWYELFWIEIYKCDFL